MRNSVLDPDDSCLCSDPDPARSPSLDFKDDLLRLGRFLEQLFSRTNIMSSVNFKVEMRKEGNSQNYENQNVENQKELRK